VEVKPCICVKVSIIEWRWWQRWS